MDINGIYVVKNQPKLYVRTCCGYIVDNIIIYGYMHVLTVAV